jgi:hypothetical protein
MSSSRHLARPPPCVHHLPPPSGHALPMRTTQRKRTTPPQYGVHRYERFEEDAFEWPFDEIGSSQLQGAPMPTQDDGQVLKSYIHFVRTNVNRILHKRGLCFHYRVRAVHSTETVVVGRKATVTAPMLATPRTCCLPNQRGRGSRRHRSLLRVSV